MPEYKEPQIVRTQDIVVVSTLKNDYGDLLVTDTDGNSYKVSNKREQLHVHFQDGARVHLQWAIYMKKEYIANAFPSEQLVKKELATKQVQKGVPTPEEVATASPARPRSEGTSPQEIGMWWKEAGELIRMWKVHPDTLPKNKKGEIQEWAEFLIRAYNIKMMTILNIKIEKKEG